MFFINILKNFWYLWVLVVIALTITLWAKYGRKKK